MLIIPAIDILGGKCVRLAQGDYCREKVYDEDPVRVALSFAEQGADWLHVVDLDGAKTGEPANLNLVAEIAKATSLSVELGGGIRSLETAERAIALGVGRVVIGTKLVDDLELSAQMFRALGEAAVAGIDARDGRAAVQGWTEASGQDAVELARTAETRGARRLIVTDIAKDGMMTGPNVGLFKRVSDAVSIPVIQSGGISNMGDLRTLAELGNRAPEGVIVGRAIYEGRLDLREALQEFTDSRRPESAISVNNLE